ncbi:MAG TPA: hypothetical protein VFX97_10160 [Pyrinomonadaceae bacterium]|nr:hypothetical protein [Pyrinomonadaceae bacterium]
MADPTTIVQYAQQRSAKLSSALAAAKLQLADAVSTIGTERAKLDAATTDFASLEEQIAAIRAKLSAIPTPADGDLLLAQLEQAIIESRAKRAAITAAKTAMQAAQSVETSAAADVTSLTAEAARAAAFLTQAEAASVDRNKLTTDLDGPLSSLNADAAKALDETKPAGANFKKAKKRVGDDLPKPLLDRALKRREAAAERIAKLTAARQTADAAVRKEREKSGAIALAASSWVTLVRAEAAAREFVNAGKSRFDQATTKLAQVADPTVAPLTPEQLGRLNAPDPLKTSRKDAADEEKAVAALHKTFEDKQKALADAIVAAKAEPDDATKQTAVTTAEGEVATAKQLFETALGTYRGGNEPIMNAWEAAVPDATWRLLHDYAEAVDTLKNMPDPAVLSKDVKDAEKNFVATQLVADKSANVLVDLTTEQRQRAAREESELQNSAANLFGALRGDN